MVERKTGIFAAALLGFALAARIAHATIGTALARSCAGRRRAGPRDTRQMNEAWSKGDRRASTTSGARSSRTGGRRQSRAKLDGILRPKAGPRFGECYGENPVF